MPIILQSAKASEIIVAYFLEEFYYHKKFLRVGDSEKCPDILSQDNSFAIEVVTCELDDFWEYVKQKRKYDWNNSRFFFNYGFNNIDLIEQFGKTLLNKIKKYHDGQYANFTNDIYLAIDSMRGSLCDCDFIMLQKALDGITKNKNAPFNKIFWLNRDAICEIINNQYRFIYKYKENEYFSSVFKCEKISKYNMSEYK